MPKPIENPNDILKRTFGKLTVDAYIGREQQGRQTVPMYLCHCECGSTDVKASRWALLKGDKSSCGCAHKDAGNAKLENLEGRVFDRWKVLEQAPTRYSQSGKTRSIMWWCQCECGTIKSVGARALKTGMSKSCGCLQKERVSEALTDDLTDRYFGYLHVLHRNGSYRSKSGAKSGVRAVWHCVCKCGQECDVIGESLKNGDITSCGCKRVSKYELYVSEYLESLGYMKDVDYFKEKTYPELLGVGGQHLRFDFLVKSKQHGLILIECQGRQHFKASEWFGGEEYLRKLQIHDMMKREFAIASGIKLVEVPYNKVLYSDVERFLKDNDVV